MFVVLVSLSCYTDSFLMCIIFSTQKKHCSLYIFFRHHSRPISDKKPYYIEARVFCVPIIKIRTANRSHCVRFSFSFLIFLHFVFITSVRFYEIVLATKPEEILFTCIAYVTKFSIDYGDFVRLVFFFAFSFCSTFWRCVQLYRVKPVCNASQCEVRVWETIERSKLIFFISSS